MSSRLLAIAVVLVFLPLAAMPDDAGGSALTVTRFDDPEPDGCAPGDCSLREAINAANLTPDADTVTLGGGVFTLSLGPLEVTQPLTLRGNTAESTFIDGGGATRVLELTGDDIVLETLGVRNGSSPQGGGMFIAGSATLRQVSVTGNEATGPSGLAGGIYTGSGSLVTLIDSTVAGNEAAYGAGIYGGGALTMLRSEIVDNTSRASGGGIHFGGGSLTIRDSQVHLNDAEGLGYGGGIFLEGEATAAYVIGNSAIYDNTAAGGYSGGIHHQGQATLHLTNTTISGNTAGAAGMTNTGLALSILTNVTFGENYGGEFAATLVNYADLTLKNTIISAVPGGRACVGDGTWNSDGHNIDADNTCSLDGVGDMPVTDPVLLPLADNGGNTLTHALGAGSPAIDNGEGCPASDQRGYARNVGPCDIGAFEYGSTGPALIWGDNNCSGAADPIDALLALRHDAGLPANTGTCPELGGPVVSSGPALTWGDVDCNGTVDPVDALKLLRYDAGLSVQQEEGCPLIGEM